VIRRNLRSDDGFSVIELVIAMVVIGILAGIVVPIALSQRANAIETSERSDVLKISISVENAITNWNGAPSAEVAITGSNGTWQALLAGDTAPQFTGNISDSGTSISGTIWSDGSYCVAATNGGGPRIIFRSDAQRVFKDQDCPTEALGGTGTIPTGIAATLPDLVTGLDASNPTDNEVLVSWDPVDGATGYTVKVSGMAAVNASSTTATIMGVAPGTATVAVYAKNANGAGAGATTTVSVTGTANASVLAQLQALQNQVSTLQDDLSALSARVTALENK
jgi:prepilin-type N-terminal cleavage/methylation domain-containing protein